jgi:TrmH family RNA methyltransferase
VISNAQIKLINSLTQKKYRKANKLFVAEGVKIINELLFSTLKIHTILGLPEWTEKNQQLIKSEKNFKTIDITEKELKKISKLSTPNQVLAVVEIPENKFPENICGLSIYLDEIKDPGNLGTIIRTADWFGINHIFCSPDCADAYNPKVVQASMGSIFRVKVYYSDLNDIKNKFPEVALIGATLGGVNISDFKIPEKKVLVIGNESKGIRPEYLELLDHKIAIPKSGNAESLNASVAMGILSYLLRY